MAAIYCADIYCDDCAEKIRSDAFKDGTVDRMIADGADPTDEATYDSDEYPKDCDGSAACDCPQHCGGCHEFLENNLTSYGADYVKNEVLYSIASGDNDSIALTVWKPFYDYIEYEDTCEWCGEPVCLGDTHCEECED